MRVWERDYPLRYITPVKDLCHTCQYVRKDGTRLVPRPFQLRDCKYSGGRSGRSGGHTGGGGGGGGLEHSFVTLWYNRIRVFICLSRRYGSDDSASQLFVRHSQDARLNTDYWFTQAYVPS